MDLRCANFETLLAMVQGRLAAPEVELVSRHVAACPRCTAELQAIETTRRALGALHAAELNAAGPRSSWAEVAAAAERPPFLMRLPSAITDAVRTSRTLAQPAIAGALAAVVLGLSLGTWLAFATQRSTGTGEAAETYSASSLLTSPSSGIADAYFDSQDATSTDGVGAGDGEVGGVKAGGVGAGGSNANMKLQSGETDQAPQSKLQSGETGRAPDSTGGGGR